MTTEQVNAVRGTAAPLKTAIPSQEELNSRIGEVERELETATTSAQLVKLLKQIEDTQLETDDLLRRYCTRRAAKRQSQTRQLELSRMGLSSTLDKSRGLKTMIEGAAGLSSKITDRVRVLDAEKSSIQKTKDYVDNVRTLKTEVQKANRFIHEEQWKKAAESISKIRALPPGIIGDSYSESVVPTSEVYDMPDELVKRWTRQLKEKFVEEFNDAAAKRDVARLTHFFQLFPLIGEEKTGLQCYSRFVCSIIGAHSREILRNCDGKTDLKPDFFSRVLFQLYQTVASIVNQHSRTIRRYYGDAVMPQLLSEIQEETDMQSGLIFDTFWDSRNMDSVVDKVRNYGYPVLVDLIYNDSSANDGEVTSDTEIEPYRAAEQATQSLAEVGGYTDEISAMMNHWAMYCKFFVVTWNDCDGTDPAKAVYPRPLITSSFMDKIHSNVAGQFDILSTFAVRRTIEKASQIEEIPSLAPQLTACVKYLGSSQRSPRANQSLHSLSPETPPVSSMIDDVTMALNVILSEALSTGELTTIKDMVSNIKRILENDFLNIMRKRLDKDVLKSNATLLTKPVLQRIHSSLSVKPRIVSSTKKKGAADKAGSPAPDLSSTGSMLLKSINTAINMATEDDPATSKALTDYVIMLNSISQFHDYLNSLSVHLINNLELENLLILDDQEYKNERKDLEEDPESTSALIVNLESSKGTPERPSVQDRIETIIRALSSGFTEKATSLLESRIKHLYQQVFRGHLVKLMNSTFKEDAYMVSSEMLPAKMGDVSPQIGTFIQQWNEMMVPFLTTMTKENFGILLRQVVGFLAQDLESRIWAMEHKCNELGAASLEKDVSVLISEITKFDYSLRNQFVRVTQIVMLMGMDDDEEIESLKDLEWALTPSERNRARALRVDRGEN